MRKKVFYVNLYRRGDGYIFGDNELRHKTLDEAVEASRDDLDYAGAVRIEILEEKGKTEFASHTIMKRV